MTRLTVQPIVGAMFDRTLFWCGAVDRHNLFSVLRVRELPLSDAEVAAIRKVPTSPAQTFRNIASAIVGLTQAMRQVALAMFCLWYAMFITGDLLRCDRAFAIRHRGQSFVRLS